MTATDKQQAHELLERVPAAQMIAAVRFLEFLVSTTATEAQRDRLCDPPRTQEPSTPIPFCASSSKEEDEEISEDEEQAVARSKEWFKHNDGIPFEQAVADLGFSMEEIRAASRKEPAA